MSTSLFGLFCKFMVHTIKMVFFYFQSKKKKNDQRRSCKFMVHTIKMVFFYFQSKKKKWSKKKKGVMWWYLKITFTSTSTWSNNWLKLFEIYKYCHTICFGRCGTFLIILILLLSIESNVCVKSQFSFVKPRDFVPCLEAN
jgi:hypothetical protein